MLSGFPSLRNPASLAAFKARRAMGQASASTEFAFRLFQQLDQWSRNLAISPYSARIALAMLWQGALGQTRRELTQGLGLNEDANAVGNRYERFGTPLDFRLEVDGSPELLTANSLWCDEGFTPRETYAETLRKEYLAHIQALNFRAAESPGIVNGWASEKTRGRIPTVVGSLRDLAPMALLNAVYFKGLWEKPFQTEETKEEEFTLLDGTKQVVPMMRQSGKFAYCERAGAQLVRLRYQGSLSMYVALPSKEIAFQKFCAGLGGILGTNWIRGMDERRGDFRLPRFRMETAADLGAPLRAMRIQQVFDPAGAALEGISERKPLYLAGVRQLDFVEVNEKGTEAAAVTRIVLGAALRPPPPPFEMIVDRPFVFSICDDFSGTVLFLGAVVDPLASGPAQAGY